MCTESVLLKLVIKNHFKVLKNALFKAMKDEIAKSGGASPAHPGAHNAPEPQLYCSTPKGVVSHASRVKFKTNFD